MMMTSCSSTSSSSSSFVIQCPCRNVVSQHTTRGEDARVYCPTCVHNSLLTSLQRHGKAKKSRDVRKEYCKNQLHQTNNKNASTTSRSLSELQYESQVLRERLASLRQECGSLAVTIASQVVENDERRAQQQGESDTAVAREQLLRLSSSLCDNAMMQALVNSTHTVKQLRFRWALQVFRMYRLDVSDPETNTTTTSTTTSRHRIARGIGKCGGLPLPHAGPELYGVLPPLELQSCLRLVASLISTLARCLGIHLPHPILLQPNGPTGDILDVATQQHNDTPAQQRGSSSSKTSSIMTSSTSSLMSLMDATSATIKRSAKKALKRATGQEALQNAAHTAIPPSMEPSLVSLRLRHATAAVIAEDRHSASSSKYELSHSQMNHENFAIGLQLLQNDAVALCIRAGVPVANLWPAQAILLNLHALDNYCHEQVDAELM